MDNLDKMRSFVYREPRLVTGFQVDFVAAGSAFHGLCRDVNDAGIRAEFDDPLVVGDSGLLILRPPSAVLELQAKVAYIEKRQVGFLFLFETSWERTMIKVFIAAIAEDAGTFPVVRI